MKKILITILLVTVATLAILFLGRNFIIKAAIEGGVSTVTGFKTKVEKVKYDLPSTIMIKGLHIKNPKEFEKETFVNIPEIFVFLSFRELISGKAIHIREARIDVQEVNIEKNKEGVSNISKLTSLAEAKEGKPAEKTEAMPFKLDRLELTMRRVSFEDRTLGIPKKVSADLNVQNEVIEGIDSPIVLANIIVMKVLYGTTFGNLGVDMNALKGSVDSALSAGKEALADAGKLATEQAEKVKEEAAKAAEDAKKKLSAVSDDATKKLSGLTEGAGDKLSGLSEKASGKLGGFMGSIKDKVKDGASKVKPTAAATT